MPKTVLDRGVERIQPIAKISSADTARKRDSEHAAETKFGEAGELELME